MTALELPAEVNVTQTEIDEGEPGSTLHCPVALALRKTTGGDPLWAVGPYYGEFYGHPVTRRVNMDDGVREWVSNFDTEMETGPITLELDWRGEQLMLSAKPAPGREDEEA